MKIIISAFGTRGDVQPSVVIASEAIRRGHDVEVIVSAGMIELPQLYNIPYKLYSGDTAKEQFGRLGGSFWAAKKIGDRVTDHIMVQAKELPAFCVDADILIGSSLDPVAASVAESCKISFVRTSFTPLFGGENRPVTFPLQRMPLFLNRVFWKFFIFLWDLMLRGPVNKGRTSLKLAPIKNYQKYIESSPTLLCLDERLAPSAPQWPSNIIYTGYPFLKSNEKLSPDLDDFLNSGDPPIYFGFGSMGSDNPERTTRIIINAIKKTKIRAVINKGWAGLGMDNLPDNIFETDNIAHDILFPHLSGVVHHGGAGTTHTAACAGIAQLIIPHITDQFYYGQSVFENKLGPQPLPFRKISEDKLSEKILLLQKQEFSKAAKDFADSMVKNGDENIIDEIEKLLLPLT